MIHDRIRPRDGERIDPDTCPDCFHLFEECVCPESFDIRNTETPYPSSAHSEPNKQQGQTTLLSGSEKQPCKHGSEDAKDGLSRAIVQPDNAPPTVQNAFAEVCEWFDNFDTIDEWIEDEDAQNSFDDRTEQTCEWFDSLPKPPEPLPWLPQEKATDRHPFS